MSTSRTLGKSSSRIWMFSCGIFWMRCRTSRPRRPRLRFMRIGGIGHQLQFAQHELRDHQRAVDETGFDDVGDAAVDDDAGVENLEGVLGRLLAAEQPAQRRQVQHVALGRAHHQAAVGHPGQQRHFEERNGVVVIGNGVVQHQRNQVSAQNSQHAAERRADQPLQADLPDAEFEQHHAARPPPRPRPRPPDRPD